MQRSQHTTRYREHPLNHQDITFSEQMYAQPYSYALLADNPVLTQLLTHIDKHHLAFMQEKHHQLGKLTTLSLKPS
ncbi:hypothetical protein [Suttonella ornithocola]|uniref:hypothetical protein n=1 Tax=Suttonella ornithocola TaxID=279832 RepID=UPI001160C770|nr:hypothetical protein [Suttonella ornithocola]